MLETQPGKDYPVVSCSLGRDNLDEDSLSFPGFGLPPTRFSAGAGIAGQMRKGANIKLSVTIQVRKHCARGRQNL